jgi:hypothetical protein
MSDRRGDPALVTSRSERLTERAVTAPNPEPYEHFEGRVRWRRVARAAVAGVAVVAMIAIPGSLVNAPSGRRNPADGDRNLHGNLLPSPDPAARSRPPLPEARLAEAALPRPVPAQKLWPRAVHTVPDHLPDGREVDPVGFADEGTLVLATHRVGLVCCYKMELWRYELSSKRFGRVTDVPHPPPIPDDDGGSNMDPLDFTVGAGRVVWWLGYTRGKALKETVEIWSAPVGGGPAERVTTIRPATPHSLEPSLLAFAGDKVIWSGNGGEVYEAPLTGGQARRIGPPGYQLVTWPWIGSPVRYDIWPETAVAPAGTKSGIFYGELYNVVTGERRSSAAVAGRWSCGLVWCLGSTRAGDALRRRNKVSGHLIPGKGSMEMSAPVVPALDRFVVLLRKGGVVDTYDLRTGRLGRLNGRGGDESTTGLTGFRPNEQIVSVEIGDDRHIVINLNAIE